MKAVPIVWLTLLVVLAGFPAWAIEKINFATAIKVTPAYYLPVLAAEEKGFWKENGLEVNWIPFRGGPDMQKAIVARSVMIGLTTAGGLIAGVSRGVPVIIVADLQKTAGVGLYVLADSPIKDPKQLAGKKIGVTRLGAVDHAYANFVAAKLGIKVRVVAAGGVPEKIAALRAGALDTFTIFMYPIMEQKVRGVVKELLAVDELLPKEWITHLVFAHKQVVKDNPAQVQRVVNAVLKSTTFIRNSRAWALATMKKMQGYSDAAAAGVYKVLRFTKDGKVNPKAVENVKQFLIKSKVIKKEKAPRVGELYTTQFTK